MGFRTRRAGRPDQAQPAADAGSPRLGRLLPRPARGRPLSAFDALAHSADTLFPVVSFAVQSYRIPDDREPFGQLARWYRWFHISPGWAPTLLAVAGFSGLIRTDSR